jgi:hypothetical protein
LFGGSGCKALSKFVTDWVETVLHPGIVRLTLTDIYAHLHPSDKGYFRKTQEEWFGMKLEEVCANPGIQCRDVALLHLYKGFGLFA